MANLYGVANAPQITFQIIGFSASTLCTANVITPVFVTGAIQAPSPGYFQILAWANLRITNSATPPTGIAFQVAIGAGSYGTASSIGGAGFTPSGSNYFTICAETPASQVAWTGAGSTVTLGITAQVNSTTVDIDSNALVMLIRSPDQ